MFRKLTQSVCLLLGLAAAQPAGAFTTWGPLELWQTADMDYGLRFYYQNIDIGTRLGYIEEGGPKNFGEGSRLATPIVTYGFDETFLEYFGAQGVAAVDSAMQVLNALPSASSANLANFLTVDNEQINYTAQALELVDLKSTVLWLMVQHMGLLGETHVWDLLLRDKYNTSACAYDYYVINRNYAPTTYDPSQYVNGRQFTYDIWDGCSIAVDVGDAIEVPTDTDSPRFTAVATGQGLQFGGYYLNLTQDDMGGLQYLYKKNNYIFQALDSNSVALPYLSSWESINPTNPIAGITNFAGVLGGVEKISFVKVEYNSLVGTNFASNSYTFSIPYVTNSRLGQLSVTRTISAPDIIFTAANLIAYTGTAVANYTALLESNTFTLSGYVSPGLSVNLGVTPSTINPPMIVTLNNVGPIYYNVNPGYLDGTNYIEYPISNWGTFDGSTNPPIVYPDGFSLAELENEVLQGGVPPPSDPWSPISLNNTNTAGTGSGGGASAAAVAAP